MNRLLVGREADFPLATSMTVGSDLPTPVAVFRTESGEFFATQDSCTHEQWSLGEDSDIEDDEIVCPLHMARYDLRTGKALCFPATVALEKFSVEVEDGSVYVIL
jgi:nitrite reductase/ring-hydroxylating ferredoxin subunit